MQWYWQLVKVPQTGAELSNRGLELLQIGNRRAALEYFDRAIVADPTSAASFFNRALAHGQLENFQDELSDYDHAIERGLDIPELHHNRGLALYKLGDSATAVAAIDQCLESCSDALRPLALNSKGLALQSLKRFDEARVCYLQALSMAPDYGVAKYNLGTLDLATGNWHDGWRGYEYRWTSSAEGLQGKTAALAANIPRWSGEPGTGKQSLLVTVEQGLGDAVQFSRYLPLLTSRFSRIGLVCPTELVRLFEASFNGNIQFLTEYPSDNRAWDWQCPLLSVPGALNTLPGSLPSNIPYLTPIADAVQSWEQRFIRDSRKRVGIVWAGSPLHRRDFLRSVPADLIAGLVEGSAEDIQWISLQKAGKLPSGQASSTADRVIDWTEELSDLADTAALISALDLVITVDTVIAHLAGSLGKPVWLLNRFESEWRWMSAGNRSIWYPTTQIYSQTTAGDWRSVLDQISRDLKSL
jgi:tetratricopeptide (TPR) repeat protein